MNRKSKLKMKLKSQVNIITFNSTKFTEPSLHCHLGRRLSVVSLQSTDCCVQSCLCPLLSTGCPSLLRRHFSQTLTLGYYPQIIRASLISLLPPISAVCLKVCPQEMKLGSCDEDFVQFGRDILFVTTHLSKRYCGHYERPSFASQDGVRTASLPSHTVEHRSVGHLSPRHQQSPHSHQQSPHSHQQSPHSYQKSPNSRSRLSSFAGP